MHHTERVSYGRAFYRRASHGRVSQRRLMGVHCAGRAHLMGVSLRGVHLTRAVRVWDPVRLPGLNSSVKSLQ